MRGAVHGGRFWEAVGGDVSRLGDVVRADVLDAWFPPAPSIVELFQAHALELIRTSPEAHAESLVRAISDARGIPAESILPGAGSSALIFLALPMLAAEAEAATILDPTYGEYAHVLENLCGIPVHRVPLRRDKGFRIDPRRLVRETTGMLVLVNPNSPTGRHIPRKELQPVVEELAETRTVWIDETYVEYVGSDESLESLAAVHPNVIVSKSMSKVYALSGLRVAYLVAHPWGVSAFARQMPPWAISLPAQAAASLAIRERDYYAGRYAETAALRRELAEALSSLGLQVTEGEINCVFVQAPSGMPPAAEIASRCAKENVFVRDASSMGPSAGKLSLRIAVRGREENARTVTTIQKALQ